MPRLRLNVLAIVLATACAPTTPSPDLSVDTLDFVVGASATWPRTGTQMQHQLADPAKREVCWVKYGNSRMFECWRWDENWIYHKVDHGLDGNTGESYEFTDGRWLPRRLAGDWSFDNAFNRIRWFDAQCQLDIEKSGEAPYRQHAWLAGALDLGPDLGVRDVLVLEYITNPSHPVVERFYFARGAGWYSWESPRGSARFDRFGGPVRFRFAACGE